MIASPAKPILDLRVSVTDRCPLRCRYCRPAAGVPVRPRADLLRFEEIAAFVCQLQRSYDVRKVRLTGGEPLARAGLPELVRRLAGLGVPDLALTTNGQWLAAQAPELRAAGLRRVNVSLDSLDPRVFKRLSRGGELARTLAGIAAALAQGLRPVKLNMLVLRGINADEVRDLAAYALASGCEVRFLELMPIGLSAAQFARWFVAADTVRDMLARDYRLTPLPIETGTTSRMYRVRDARGRIGRIGFIAPGTHAFCRPCRRLRLTADGQLVGCLARQDESANIRPLLKSPAAWPAGGGDELVARVLGRRSGRRFDRCAAMVAVGG